MALFAAERNYNSLHLNALYDILNRTYVDAIVQPGVQKNEHAALHDMLTNFHPDDPAHTIITVDRGYESYNLIAQSLHKNLRFVIRAKAPSSSRSLLSSYKNELPDHQEEFDVEISRFITRSRNKIMKEQTHVYLEHKADKHFDYASSHAHGKDKLCYISFRVVKIKHSEDSFEYIITNLPPNEFNIKSISDIYHMRWDIETSFRQLKYSVGMMNFHSKNKHAYAINYTMVAKICHKFLKRPANTAPPDVIGWIERNLAVVKAESRSFARNMRGIGAVSFFYRTT